MVKQKSITGAYKLTVFNSLFLQVFNRDEDLSSDQGSSIDSGRGPSEEEPDRSLHNQSLSISPEQPDSPHKSTQQDYICMNRLASQPDSKTPRRSSSDTTTAPTLPPRKPRNPRLVPPPSYHSNHRFASASSPDIILQQQRRQEMNQNQLPSAYTGQQHVVTGGGSYNDVSGKNIGRYNCKNPRTHRTTGQVTGPYIYTSSPMDTKDRPDHWSGFDYNCDAGDSQSEGGSSTSGSYMVDTVELDREIANDVFV